MKLLVPIVIISMLFVACGPVHHPEPWESLTLPTHEERLRAWWDDHGIERQPIVLFWCHAKGRGPVYATRMSEICMVTTEGSWIFMFPKFQMRMAHEATLAHEWGEHVYHTMLAEDGDGLDHDEVADCLAGAYWGDSYGRKSARWTAFTVWRQIAIVLGDKDRSRSEPWMLGAREGLSACHPFFE